MVQRRRTRDEEEEDLEALCAEHDAAVRTVESGLRVFEALRQAHRQRLLEVERVLERIDATLARAQAIVTAGPGSSSRELFERMLAAERAAAAANC